MDHDLKEVVIQAGLEILDEQGLTLALNSVTYAKVFGYLAEEYSVPVTRGSVHERIWANQNEYRRDVLAEVVTYLPRFEVGETFSAIANGTTTATEDGVRRISTELYEQMMDSAAFGQPSSVKALASHVGDEAAAELLRKLLTQRSESMLAEGRTNLPLMAAGMGLRRRSSLDLSWNASSDILQTAFGVLLEGGYLNLKSGSFDIFSPTRYGSAISDDVDPWRIVSIGLKGLLDFLFEQDPASGSEHQQATIDGARGFVRVRAVPIVDPEKRSAGVARRSRQELKRLVTVAGAELLLRDGLQLGPELLGYTAVFEHIQATRGYAVHRSSVHGRIWENNEAFRMEVLARSLLSSSHAVPSSTAAMESVPPAFDIDGQLDPLQTAYDVMRNLSNSYSVESPGWRDYQRLLQIKATQLYRQDSTDAAKLRSVIRTTDRARLDHNKVLIQHHLLDLGFAVRPEVNLKAEDALELFGVLVMNTYSGMMLNTLAGLNATDRTMSLTRSGTAGGHDDWTIAGIALRSYFDQLYELAQP